MNILQTTNAGIQTATKFKVNANQSKIGHEIKTVKKKHWDTLVENHVQIVQLSCQLQKLNPQKQTKQSNFMVITHVRQKV